MYLYTVSHDLLGPVNANTLSNRGVGLVEVVSIGNIALFWYKLTI